jgi:hypothetical protein
MAGEHCESGYWLVASTGDEACTTEVEQHATFEQARARWEAHRAAGWAVEVFAADGLLLLYWGGGCEMECWEMSAPRRPGRYSWDEHQGYALVSSEVSTHAGYKGQSPYVSV